MNTAEDPEQLLALAREFMANPIGKHTIKLERLLLRFRNRPVRGRLVVIWRKPHEEWVIGRLSGKRGAPIELVDEAIYRSAEDANRQIFRLRWQEEFGKELGF